MRQKKNVTVRMFGSGLEFNANVTMEVATQLIALVNAAGRRKPAAAPAKD